nr:hypothetical protein CFP56_66472 [Quercus suber]
MINSNALLLSTGRATDCEFNSWCLVRGLQVLVRASADQAASRGPISSTTEFGVELHLGTVSMRAPWARAHAKAFQRVMKAFLSAACLLAVMAAAAPAERGTDYYFAVYTDSECTQSLQTTLIITLVTRVKWYRRANDACYLVWTLDAWSGTSQVSGSFVSKGYVGVRDEGVSELQRAKNVPMGCKGKDCSLSLDNLVGADASGVYLHPPSRLEAGQIDTSPSHITDRNSTFLSARCRQPWRTSTFSVAAIPATATLAAYQREQLSKAEKLTVKPRQVPSRDVLGGASTKEGITSQPPTIIVEVHDAVLPVVRKQPSIVVAPMQAPPCTADASCPAESAPVKSTAITKVEVTDQQSNDPRAPKHEESESSSVVHYSLDELRAIGDACRGRLPPVRTLKAMMVYELFAESEATRLFRGELFALVRTGLTISADNQRLLNVEKKIHDYRRYRNDFLGLVKDVKELRRLVSNNEADADASDKTKSLEQSVESLVHRLDLVETTASDLQVVQDKLSVYIQERAELKDTLTSDTKELQAENTSLRTDVDRLTDQRADVEAIALDLQAVQQDLTHRASTSELSALEERLSHYTQASTDTRDTFANEIDAVQAESAALRTALNNLNAQIEVVEATASELPALQRDLAQRATTFDISVLQHEHNVCANDLVKLTNSSAALKAENTSLRADLEHLTEQHTDLAQRAESGISRLEDLVRALTAQQSQPLSSATALHRVPVQMSNGQRIDMAVPKGSGFTPSVVGNENKLSPYLRSANSKR